METASLKLHSVKPAEEMLPGAQDESNVQLPRTRSSAERAPSIGAPMAQAVKSLGDAMLANEARRIKCEEADFSQSERRRLDRDLEAALARVAANAADQAEPPGPISLWRILAGPAAAAAVFGLEVCTGTAVGAAAAQAGGAGVALWLLSEAQIASAAHAMDRQAPAAWPWWAGTVAVATGLGAASWLRANRAGSSGALDSLLSAIIVAFVGGCITAAWQQRVRRIRAAWLAERERAAAQDDAARLTTAKATLDQYISAWTADSERSAALRRD